MVEVSFDDITYTQAAIRQALFREMVIAEVRPGFIYISEANTVYLVVNEALDTTNNGELLCRF